MTEAHGKNWVSLRMRLVIVLLVATMLGFGGGIGFRMLGEYLVDTVYLAPEQAERRCSAMMDSFQQMVERGQISVRQSEIIHQWVRQQRYVYLVIHAEEETMTYSGWMVTQQDGKRLEATVREPEPRDTGEDYSTPDAAYRTIAFSDGRFRVRLYDYTDIFLRGMVHWMGYFLGTGIVLTVTLLYHKMVILRFIRLNKQVEEVARGNLHGEIDIHSDDEIGDLSDYVSAMRDTIMEKMREEQMAWNANSNMITRMSHDIRTSLTVLTGFLELLEEGSFSTDESYLEYLSICRRNAAQLKVQADQLFQFLLVLGQQSYELKLEVVNAKTLLSQLIGEHITLMQESGWQISVDPLDHPVQVQVDTVVMKRLIDNLFSNVKKYADSSEPVIITGRQEGEQIYVMMRNRVSHDPDRMESSGIGLKTCERIVERMGGTFSAWEKSDYFQVDILLPVWQGGR